MSAEFTAHAAIWPDSLSRRSFLTVMGASLALAGLHGCARPPDEQIVPYVKQPEGITPGKPLFFATAMCLDGVATGLLVHSEMGRPIKVEGNPQHPSVPPAHGVDDDPLRAGASDVFAQAAVLSLYDPDRSQTVTRAGQISTWGAFLTALRERLDGQKEKRGAGIRILTETVCSPTLREQLLSLREKEYWPAARWVEYEPVNHDHEIAGAKLAFDQPVRTHYSLENADVILSLDADFLACGPDHLQHARRFAQRRRAPSGGDPRQMKMNRLYAVETTTTLTGLAADHRLPLRQAELEWFALALAKRLGVDVDVPENDRLSATTREWLEPLAADLLSAGQPKGQRSLVIAGPWQPPMVHALAHAMNQALGNVGTTVTYTNVDDTGPNDRTGQTESLARLVKEMQDGGVQILLILGGNPIYTAPAELDFATALAKVPLVVSLSPYEDETSLQAHWHIPEAHFLESWSDARAHDGTATIVQPLIAPLYDGKSAHELLSAVLGEPGQTAHDIVKRHWQRYWPSQPRTDSFEAFWQTALHDGVVDGTQATPKEPSELPLRKDFREHIPTELRKSAASRPVTSPKDNSQAGQTVDLLFRPDPTIWDGRFANNGWLQELPKPLTKLTWDNAALVGPALAQQLKLASGNVVEIERSGRRLQIPVWVVPGHPADSVTIHLGYGRTRAGRVGTGVGVNAYELRTSDAPWFAPGAVVRKTGERRELACTQRYPGIEDQALVKDRELIHAGTLDEYRKSPDRPPFMPAHAPEETSLYPKKESKGNQWGMSIDLSTCIGCNACVIACQAENNIPVVGKEQVLLGRQMQWIRVDTYYEGEPDRPSAVHQPVPCMHCETAPCEPVCPVAATVHSEDGLNQMVYNRCVGTRYCSNNCPYKVRRFNFLQYSDLETPSLKLLRNPEVTVRNRGVMEKCTYCIQRISAARIEAEKQGRRIRDGEVVTACQAACPTQAIVFGDLNDPKSDVKRRKELPLDYALLGELGTRPRTTYLAALKNPNPGVRDQETGIRTEATGGR
jgi:Fe-S-cluster-containing dehydrogenase component